LRQADSIDFAAGPSDFTGHAAAAGGIGKDPVGTAAVAFLSELTDVLLDLVCGELLAGELIGLALGLGISIIRRRFVVPDAPRRFFAIVFPFDDRQLLDFLTSFGAD